ISGNARPTIFNCETVCDQRGEVVREIDSADPAEADAHWVALSNVEEPPPEPWVPVRPFRKGSSGDRAGVLKGFPQGDRGWKSYFFYVRLDQASVAVECLPSFRRLWGVGGNVLNDHSLFSYHPLFFTLYLNYVYFVVHNPIPPFLEDLCVVRNLLRGGPLLWGYFSPERVRAAVETHRSCFSSSIDDDMGVFLKILPCLLSMPLGRAVVKGRPTLRMMQNRPLRIPSLGVRR
ncbi:hypothetical protein HID58_093162, partial [Brassica napus]